MVIQGIVEVLRCILCIRNGEWPQRLHDVEELEKVILEEAERNKQAELTRGRSDRARKGSSDVWPRAIPNSAC